MTLDPKFSAYINVNNLDNIYREFFIQAQSVGISEQIEMKNRCFKDLYNILEESVYKFYELFTLGLST